MISDEIINRKQFFSNFKGVETLIPTMILDFQALWPTIFVEIQEAAANKDFFRIEKTAHTIKGMVSNFRAGRAVAAALQIEVKGRNAQILDLEDDILCLHEELKLLSQFLDQMLKDSELGV